MAQLIYVSSVEDIRSKEKIYENRVRDDDLEYGDMIFGKFIIFIHPQIKMIYSR